MDLKQQVERGSAATNHLPSRMVRVRHHLAGNRDGRRAARRLSHLGAHVWVARRRQHQAALDAEVALLVEEWTAGAAPAVAVLGARRADGVSADSPQAEGTGTRPETMVEIRAARRKKAVEAARNARLAEAETNTAGARSQIVTLSRDTASLVWAAQARQSLLFALYTRAFLRAYSKATTQHAPEPTWLRHIVNPASLTLTQTVIANTGVGIDA